MSRIFSFINSVKVTWSGKTPSDKPDYSKIKMNPIDEGGGGEIKVTGALHKYKKKPYLAKPNVSLEKQGQRHNYKLLSTKR